MCNDNFERCCGCSNCCTCSNCQQDRINSAAKKDADKLEITMKELGIDVEDIKDDFCVSSLEDYPSYLRRLQRELEEFQKKQTK